MGSVSLCYRPVFLHGGGFHHQLKNGHMKPSESLCKDLARLGMVVLAPDFRIGKQHDFSKNPECEVFVGDSVAADVSTSGEMSGERLV